MTSAWRRVVVWVTVLSAVAGCGYSTYEQRFEETKRYFAYLDLLNQYLNRSPWAGTSVKLRVPKQFKGILAPQPEKGKETDKQHDPRQPTFLSLELPGIQGAWTANLPLVGADGSAPAYLYVLSNFGTLAKEQKGQKKEDEPADFIQDVLKRVGAAVEHPVPSYDRLTTLEVPRGEAWVNKLAYKIDTDFPLNLDGKDYHIQAYCYKKERSPAEAVIVYILPDNVSPGEKLDKAIELSLETLEITQDKPVALPGQGSPRKGSSGPVGI